GTISATRIPDGITIAPDSWDVDLPAGERAVFSSQIIVHASYTFSNNDWVVFQGEFGGTDRPVLAFQVNRPEQG
ncbi:MAG TPA: hypothetical protein PLD73_14350, partial [Candidatus Hydrogenedentes bacterium]|nr:hypothetical protein [Candidatus Hydrogenedentota bacterium]